MQNVSAALLEPPEFRYLPKSSPNFFCAPTAFGGRRASVSARAGFLTRISVNHLTALIQFFAPTRLANGVCKNFRAKALIKVFTPKALMIIFTPKTFLKVFAPKALLKLFALTALIKIPRRKRL